MLESQAHGFSEKISSQSISINERKARKSFQKPILAIVTEPDALSSEQRAQETLKSIEEAVRSDCVDMVTIRCMNHENDCHYHNLMDDFINKLIKIRKHNINNEGLLRCWKIILNYNFEFSIEKYFKKLDGIHVKEKNLNQIPLIREKIPRHWYVGTSVHSIESASRISLFEKGLVDYLFVGTCFATQSHPGKTNLEGPELIFKICKFLGGKNSDVLVLAIGGIKQENALIPLKYGADGVAIIRSIIRAKNPEKESIGMRKILESGI